jgi:diguanylate cyclase (GGDEF)-like protein
MKELARSWESNLMANSNSPKALKDRIRELEEKVKILERDLIHDSLTGLKTRAFFGEEVGMYLDVITNSSEENRKESFGFKHLSVLFIDVDYFKKINDVYGHLVGDEVLKAVAREIEGGIRDEDIAARWGGEEIVVALLGADETDALEKAERIRRSVLGLVFAEEGLTVTVSIGIATHEKGIDFSTLLARADEALYLAKQSGRNMVCTWSAISE